MANNRPWGMGGLPRLRPGKRPRARLFPDNPEPPDSSRKRPRVHEHSRPSPLIRHPGSELNPPPRVGSCNHVMMAVIHSTTEECSRCGLPSPSGRLYRCTVDKEVEIIEAKEEGDEVTSDKVGEIFEDAMTLGKFGADARSKENSLLNEMTPAQLASYTPEQLKTLLAQRARVHEKIAEARGPDSLSQPYPARQTYPDDDKPWVAAEKFRCRHQVCASCDRHAHEKTWTSLNGVLNGDILPTLAVGLSPDGFPFREPADANVVKNLGFQAVPLPRDHPARPPPPPPTTTRHKPRPAQTNSLDQSDGVAASDRAAFYIAGGATIFDDDAAGGLTAVPRSMPELTMDDDDDDDVDDDATPISVDDFIFEYAYSEHTLACCTPLPKAGREEKCFLSGEERAEKGVDECFGLTEEAVERDVEDVKIPIVTSVPCDDNWV